MFYSFFPQKRPTWLRDLKRISRLLPCQILQKGHCHSQVSPGQPYHNHTAPGCR